MTTAHFPLSTRRLDAHTMGIDERSKGARVYAELETCEDPRLVEQHAVAYDDLYRTQRPRILRLCRLLLADPDEADDVAQEIFLKLLRQHRRGDGVAWGPWLTRVTVNACRDRRRSGWWKWWRERHQEFEEATLPAGGVTPEQAALGSESRQQVWRSFRQLSARQQEVFALRYIEECSTDEVADLLGLSPGSVKRHLYRAVHQLRKTVGGSR
ncbi:MAG: sigma-70 family RNA polymerase sigma factor [Candidatus Binatia bacterium]